MASMTYRELRRLLVDHGCRYLRDARGGGHEIWLCPGRKPISVPKTLKGEGTLQRVGWVERAKPISTCKPNQITMGFAICSTHPTSYYCKWSQFTVRKARRCACTKNAGDHG